ncbi:hypothetical protein CMV_029821, partial [Castanea mollissima]
MRKVLKPDTVISQGSSQRNQGAIAVEEAVVGDCPHLQGGAKNIGKPISGGPLTDGSASFASVVVGHRKNTTGRGIEGKKKSALGGVKIMSESSRNFSKKRVLGQREQVGEKLVSDPSCAYRVSCKASTLGQKELLGAKDISTGKETETDGMKSELSLDLFMRLERGLDGKWAVVWSEVNEVGPTLKPTKPINNNLIPSSPIVPAKPRREWRPRQTPVTLISAHCQSSYVAHALGARVQVPMEVQVPRVGQVGLSSRDEEVRSEPARDDDPVTGKDGVASCSADKDIIDAGKAPAGFLSPDTEMLHQLGFWDLGDTGDLMGGSDLARNGPGMYNGLVPSLDLGKVLEVEFGEGEAHAEVVDSVGATQLESGLIIHPRESSGVVDSGCGSGENEN